MRAYWLCWIAYASVYLVRANLSAALPGMESSLSLSRVSLGFLGSMFFWVYGAGQLVNGQLGDRLNPRWFVALGIAVAGTVNIIFGLSSKFALFVVCWAINGWFLSFLWGPIIRSVSDWFGPAKCAGMAIKMSTSMIGGSLIALIVSGYIMDGIGWRYVFILPGLFAIGISVMWAVLFRPAPKHVWAESDPSHQEEEEVIKVGTGSGTARGYSMRELFVKSRMWFMLVACFSQAVIKDGIGLWGPVYFMEQHGLDVKNAIFTTATIPVVNFSGVLLTLKLYKSGRLKMMVASMLFVCTLLTIGLLLFGKSNLIMAILFLCTSSALMFGVNSLLINVYPLSFAQYGRVSGIAGFLNSCSYAASGLAAMLSGFMLEAFGWNSLIIMWGCIAVLGTIVTLIGRFDMDDKKTTLK